MRAGSLPPPPTDKVRHIYWKNDRLVVLDQRRLPGETVYLICPDPSSVAAAIKDMALRGAPLIGCAAACGYALAAKRLKAGRRDSWKETLAAAGRLLLDSRPTAVNLRHALDRMAARSRVLLAEPSITAAQAFKSLKEEADACLKEDLEANRRMADLGASLLPRASVVVTYCNTGTLATSGLGTALGVIRRGYQLGRVKHVYPCETRPYLQGSRLTLWELMREGLPATLLCDNMAAHLMATEHIDAVLVGADRIAANGDVANKIGTYGLAILARHHGIPFYVVAPSTTVDLKVKNGGAIPIEERSAREVVEIGHNSIAPAGAKARHPAFDVTPHQLVTAIVTERGIVRPPDEFHLKRIIRSWR